MTPEDRQDFRQMVGGSLTKAASDIARVSDPGEREIASGTFLPATLLEEPDELLSEALDIVAEAHGGPVVLAGMAVAAPTPIAVGARVRLEELDDPPRGLGLLTVSQAWEMDAHEPVVGIFLLCSREGAAGRQVFSFTVETLVSGGAVKDGFVTGTSESARFVKKLTGSLPEDVELRSLEPSEAAARIVAAAAQGARAGLAPTDDGLAALTVFLRASQADDADAIVQALELGESLADRVDELEDEARTAAVDDLAAEAEAWLEQQGFDRERIMAARFAVGLMGDYRAHYLGADLTGWITRELDEFMLDWVPRKVSLDDEECEAFPESVVDALTFLSATGRLAERQATALSARVRRQAERFTAEMEDPTNVGPAKAMFDAMTAEGVEVGNPEAMQAWLDDFNARPYEERDRILGPALSKTAGVHGAPPPSKAKARKAQKQARRRNRGR